MRKPIYLHQDYTLNEEGYQLKLPLNLGTIIPADDSVRLLSQFVEAMDLTDLYSTYERINTVLPRTLFYEEVIFLTEIDQPYRKKCKKETAVSRFINR